MISYFRSGPGECWRFRSDTRYATHTSDYGRRRWSSCGRPGPSSGTYTLPTSYQDILHLLWLWSSIMHRRLPPSHLQLSSRSVSPSALSFLRLYPRSNPFCSSAALCSAPPARFVSFYSFLLFSRAFFHCLLYSWKSLTSEWERVLSSAGGYIGRITPKRGRRMSAALHL